MGAEDFRQLPCTVEELSAFVDVARIWAGPEGVIRWSSKHSKLQMERAPGAGTANEDAPPGFVSSRVTRRKRSFHRDGSVNLDDIERRAKIAGQISGRVALALVEELRRRRKEGDQDEPNRTW